MGINKFRAFDGAIHAQFCVKLETKSKLKFVQANAVVTMNEKLDGKKDKMRSEKEKPECQGNARKKRKGVDDRKYNKSEGDRAYDGQECGQKPSTILEDARIKPAQSDRKSTR